MAEHRIRNIEEATWRRYKAMCAEKGITLDEAIKQLINTAINRLMEKKEEK